MNKLDRFLVTVELLWMPAGRQRIAPGARPHIGRHFSLPCLKNFEVHELGVSADRTNRCPPIVSFENSLVWSARSIIPVAWTVIFGLPHDDIIRPIYTLAKRLLLADRVGAERAVHKIGCVRLVSTSEELAGRFGFF